MLLSELEALRRSEAALRDFIETSTIGFHSVGADGTILWVNQAELDLLGYAREEYVGRNIGEFHADGAVINDLLRLLGRGEKLREYPARLRHRDGSIRHVLLDSSVLFEDGKFVHTRCFTRDVTHSKHVEEALRKSEERFRLATKATNDAIWDIDLKTGTVSWNETYTTLYGRPPESSDSWQWWIDNIHAEDRERTAGDLRTAIGSGASSWTCEYRIRRVDGEWAHIYDRAYIARDALGNAWRVIGAMQDLTDRKQAETRLRESEERLRANEIQLKGAQRLAKIGSWDRDLDAGESRWSAETRRIFGLPDGAPASFAVVVNCVHPKDREKVLEAERNVRSSRTPLETEYRIIRPDGEVRLLRSVFEAITNDQGVPVRILGATQDITEQAKARELLRASEGYLKNAERLAQLGHWHWDLKTNQVIWSEECARIFGQLPNYTPSLEVMLQALVPEDRERVERETGHRLAEKKGGAIEFRIVRADGELRTIRSVSEMLLDEEGRPASFFGACQDITEERRAQEESFARQKLESVGTLASGIAHDFNNLLGAVLAQAELALGELAAGSRPEEELNAIRNVAIQGSEIVRQLMTYAGQDSAAGGPVDVSRTVEEMLQLLQVSVSKKAVLETDLGKDLLAVRADAAQLRQIVLNLVMNASEALGDRDGVIRVTTKCVEHGISTIPKGLTEGDYVQLEVSDSGYGMSQETQARVFDPFFTTKSAGHGLGLAVVHGIVRGLRGAIHVASEPGTGTTFRVLLPCAESTAGASSAPISGTGGAAHSSGPFTVLVIEDEDPLRQAVVKVLRKKGFGVLDAANGSAAIELLRAYDGKIDVILLDMTIPGASSHEVVAEAAQARPEARVVLTSAFSQEMLTLPTNSVRISGFIRKPFQLEDLVKTLRGSLVF